MEFKLYVGFAIKTEILIHSFNRFVLVLLLCGKELGNDVDELYKKLQMI